MIAFCFREVKAKESTKNIEAASEVVDKVLLCAKSEDDSPQGKLQALLDAYNETLPDGKKCHLTFKKPKSKAICSVVCFCRAVLGLHPGSLQPLKTHHKKTCERLKTAKTKAIRKGNKQVDKTEAFNSLFAFGLRKKAIKMRTAEQYAHLEKLTETGKWLREKLSDGKMKNLKIMLELTDKLELDVTISSFQLNSNKQTLKHNSCWRDGGKILAVCHAGAHFFPLKPVQEVKGAIVYVGMKKTEVGLWKGIAKHEGILHVGNEANQQVTLVEAACYEAQDYGQYAWGTGTGLEYDESLQKIWKTVGFKTTEKEGYGNSCALVTCIVALLSNNLLTEAQLIEKLIKTSAEGA